jgi:hypothetical protein
MYIKPEKSNIRGPVITRIDDGGGDTSTALLGPHNGCDTQHPEAAPI